MFPTFLGRRRVPARVQTPKRQMQNNPPGGAKEEKTLGVVANAASMVYLAPKEKVCVYERRDRRQMR